MLYLSTCTPLRYHTAAVLCPRFWRLGRCAKGAACAFPHTGEPVTRLVPCRFWRQGRCSRGDACPFSHDPATPEPCQEALQAGGCLCVVGICPRVLFLSANYLRTVVDLTPERLTGFSRLTRTTKASLPHGREKTHTALPCV